MKNPGKRKTTVGQIDEEVLTYTAGRDVELDQALIDVDCIGTAAHVTMLADIPVKPRLFSKNECQSVIAELVRIMQQAKCGRFHIRAADQDVHLAVERVLTKRLGDTGKKVHTGRSRNDQVALDLRLHGKLQLIKAVEETALLAQALFDFAKRHEMIPMVGRTHMQPAMPSTVGLWAIAHVESLLNDAVLMMNAYELNDQCPLGAAAGYGVPLPLNREKVADLLGFSRTTQNVLYAVTARGKMESIILGALTQAMITLSRLAEDLIMYSMPEFGYFTLPPDFCTGSSIMPQKNNPDILELVRARTSGMLADQMSVLGVLKGLPTGYNRDVQETKAPYMQGFQTARSSLRVMARLIRKLKINRNALRDAFMPEVFATDKALQLVADGTPFRDAYHHVKNHMAELEHMNPDETVACKTSTGDTAGLDLDLMKGRIGQAGAWARDEARHFSRVITKLLGHKYPFPVDE